MKVSVQGNVKRIFNFSSMIDECPDICSCKNPLKNISTVKIISEHTEGLHRFGIFSNKINFLNNFMLKL